MDQQQLNTLDPKLREAYDRIMGTNVPAAKPPLQAKPSAPQQTAQPIQPAPATQTNPVQNAPVPDIKQPDTPPMSPITPISQTTQTPAPQTPATPVQTTPAAATQPVNQPPVQVQSTAPISPFFGNVAADNQMHAYVAEEVAGAKQSIKTIELIYIVGGVVFFVVYALFWLKFFNLSSPF